MKKRTFLLGALLGGAGTLFMTSKSGVKFRSEIREKSAEKASEIKEKVGRATALGCKKADKASVKMKKEACHCIVRVKRKFFD